MRRRPVALACVSLAAALPASATAVCGLTVDQMIPMETALRLLAGQGFLVDFEMPVGPIVGWGFAPFALVMPTLGWAHVLASVTLNAGVAAMAFRLLLGVTDDLRTATLGGALTAVAFLPPFGAFYTDHLAYALVLLSALLCLRESPSPIALATAGLAAALAVHTKITVGTFGVLCLVATLAGFRLLGPARLGTVLGAFVFGFVALVGLFAWEPGLDFYIDQQFRVPRAFAAGQKSFADLGLTLLLPFKVNPVAALREGGMGRLIFLPIAASFYGSYVVLLHEAWTTQPLLRRRTVALLAFASFSTLLCGALLGRNPFHVVFGGGIVMALLVHYVALRWRLTRTVRTAISVVLVVGVTVVLGALFLATRAGRIVPAPGELTPIRLVDGTYHEIPCEELVKVAEFIRANHEGPIAALDDYACTIPLALGRAPVDRPVWYHGGLNPPNGKPRRRAWSRRMIETLRRCDDVWIVVTRRTNAAFRRGGMGLKDVPILQDWLEANGREVFATPHMRVLARQSGGPQSGTTTQRPE